MELTYKSFYFPGWENFILLVIVLILIYSIIHSVIKYNRNRNESKSD